MSVCFFGVVHHFLSTLSCLFLLLSKFEHIIIFVGLIFLLSNFCLVGLLYIRCKFTYGMQW